MSRNEVYGNLVYRCSSCMNDINILVSTLFFDNRKVFDFGSQNIMPDVKGPAELGFLYCVSWFYISYFEIGKIDINFLISLLDASENKKATALKKVKQDIHDLRTFFHHKLDVSKTTDQKIEKNCRKWFSSACNTSLPGTEEQWNRCLIELLETNLKFLKEILNFIRLIESAEVKEITLVQWKHRRDRYHAPHEFDKIISEVTHDIGRDGIDIVALRKRYYDRWVGQLSILEPDYDFNIEARKMIELVLLSELDHVLPINGKDIIIVFNIEPGPLVGTLLQRAREIYTLNPCSKEDLIKQMTLDETVNVLLENKIVAECI